MYEAKIFSDGGRTFVRDALLWHQHAQKFTAQVLAWLLKGGQLFVGRRWRRQIAKNMPSNEPWSTPEHQTFTVCRTSTELTVQTVSKFG